MTWSNCLKSGSQTLFPRGALFGKHVGTQHPRSFCKNSAPSSSFCPSGSTVSGGSGWGGSQLLSLFLPAVTCHTTPEEGPVCGENPSGSSHTEVHPCILNLRTLQPHSSSLSKGFPCNPPSAPWLRVPAKVSHSLRLHTNSQALLLDWRWHTLYFEVLL